MRAVPAHVQLPLNSLIDDLSSYNRSDKVVYIEGSLTDDEFLATEEYVRSMTNPRAKLERRFYPTIRGGYTLLGFINQ